MTAPTFPATSTVALWSFVSWVMWHSMTWQAISVRPHRIFQVEQVARDGIEAVGVPAVQRLDVLAQVKIEGKVWISFIRFELQGLTPSPGKHGSIWGQPGVIMWST